MKSRIIVLGDIHFPYHHKKALQKALLTIKKEKPTHVVQIGDLYDQYNFSRYIVKNLSTPEEELTQARGYAERMWGYIRKVSPRSKLYQMFGNHDIRLLKRAQEKNPQTQEMVREGLKKLYTFKGVETIFDDKEILYIEDIAFHHGYLSKLGDHMRKFLKKTVVGHSHTPGLSVENIHGKTCWELNVGYLADGNAEPLKYNPTKVSKWTLGFGRIDEENGPRFIPHS